jgi:hypothetical protein
MPPILRTPVRCIPTSGSDDTTEMRCQECALARDMPAPETCLSQLRLGVSFLQYQVRFRERERRPHAIWFWDHDPTRANRSYWPPLALWKQLPP